MNESQTRLLIQRELDGNLSQEEESRLRRILMVNDSAVSFRANLSKIVAAARDLELPDQVRPGDSSHLAVEIIENLPAIKGGFWHPLFDIFANRKNTNTDLRRTRSVGSAAAPAARQMSSGNHSLQNITSPGTTSGANHSSLPKVDPAVLNPDRNERGKTPQGMPASDQYITGTYSAVGGLAKKLSKNQGQVQVEDVGKTLADAIREKVHETQNILNEEGQTNSSADTLDTAPEAALDPCPPIETVSQPQDRAALLPIAAVAPHMAPAQITTQQVATTVNLGNSLVLTVSVQPSADIQAPVKPAENTITKGHDFSAQELGWKSGTYPTVPQPARQKSEAQTETGPLAPFPFNNSAAIAKFKLKDTVEIINQLQADTQREKEKFAPGVSPAPEQARRGSAQQSVSCPVSPANPPWTAASISDAWAPSQPAWVPPPTPDSPAPPADPWAPPMAPAAVPGVSWTPHPVSSSPVSTPTPTPVTPAAPATEPSGPVVAYEPTIVPVTRKSLPIDAIEARIDQLLNEPIESRPPTPAVHHTRETEAARPHSGQMETSVGECLTSIGRLVDIRYATNNPGNIDKLGRFLLTDETIQSIGNCINKGLNQSNARVVTLEAAQQMACALEPVFNTRGVIGYLVCGYDGLLITHKLPNDVDVEMLGGCALVTYMNSDSIMKVMGHKAIKQMICQTPGGSMLLSDFGKGYLVTLTTENDPGMLTRLTETIAMVAAG